MSHFHHHKSKIEVQLFESCADLPNDWNQMLPENHFLKSNGLSIYETMKLPNVSFLYVRVLKNGETVALGYFQVLTIKKEHLNTHVLKPLQVLGWQLFTTIFRPKLLILGHLFRHDIDSFFAIPTATSFESFQYCQAATKAAMKKSCAAAALIKDMPEDLITYFQNYAPEFLLLRNDINMEMGIQPDWLSMNDYEKSLKHKYAQRYRKVRQNLEKLVVKELSVDDVETNKKILFDLYTQVTNHQQVRLGFLNEDFLPILKKKYPEELLIWIAYEEEKPVGFYSAWKHDDIFDMFYIGFDYSRNDDLQLYFNILYFSIEKAIDFKKQKLILGRTALEAKARLGCKPKYLSTYLFIKNSFVRNIILRLQNNITNQEGEWENRHPFKK